jgi:hypothetical protein
MSQEFLYAKAKDQEFLGTGERKLNPTGKRTWYNQL